MNKVILTQATVGRAELLETDKGDALKLSVVTEDGYYDKSNKWVDLKDWHIVIKWKPSENQKRIDKGDLVEIEGKLKTRHYEKDGKKVYVTEVIASYLRRTRIKNKELENKQDEPIDDLPF